MLASVKNEGLNLTITPGFTWDEEQLIFKGEVLYGDEVLTICISKERMQRSINAAFETNTSIEQLFLPEVWIPAAEHPHDHEVYFEEDDELGPEDE
ncbi:MAG TPA: hypothetical protein VH593_23690 [Ktedonobacteraceae bacterium]